MLRVVKVVSSSSFRSGSDNRHARDDLLDVSRHRSMLAPQRPPRNWLRLVFRDDRSLILLRLSHKVP